MTALSKQRQYIHVFICWQYKMKKKVNHSKTHIVHEMLLCFVLKAKESEADFQNISINDKLISANALPMQFPRLLGHGLADPLDC